MNAVLKPVATEVAEIYHAKLGASGASGWLNCAAWAGGGAGSKYAASGSIIHEVSADCLALKRLSPNDALGEVFTSDGFTMAFDTDMARIAEVYVNHCEDLHASVGGTRLVELSLPIDHITCEPDAVSTIDFGLLPAAGSTEAVVIDLKTGAGVPVDAVDNPQLAMYALAMLDEYSMLADIQSVRMIIVQPPLNSISEWVQTAAELEVWRVKFAEAAAAAMALDPVPTPGDKQCRWCTKKAECPALNTIVFEAVDAVDPLDVPTDDLAVAMSRVDLIEGWCKAVRAETEKRLLDGRNVQGWKLVQGKKGNRAWSDKAAAEAMLKTMRVPHDQMYDYSVISPTSADKLAKAEVIGPRQWPKLAALITQTDGKPSVAPVSDKRPVITPDVITFQPVNEEVTTS